MLITGLFKTITFLTIFYLGFYRNELVSQMSFHIGLWDYFYFEVELNIRFALASILQSTASLCRQRVSTCLIYILCKLYIVQN